MAQKENRILTGGIDTDSAPYAIAQDGLLKAVNVRALRQNGQQAGGIGYIEGNTELTSVTNLIPSGESILLGKCADELNKRLYLFLNNSESGNYIVEYDQTTDAARIVISDGSIIDGTLGWNADTYISCGVADNKLFWVDGMVDVCYCRIDKTYGASSVTFSELTLIVAPGLSPLVPVRNSIAGASSSIQSVPVQFTYRIINQDKFISVLSPYSLTSYPARQDELTVDSESGNAITVSLPTQQKIPSNWFAVEFVARFLNAEANTNSFYVIKSWQQNNPADAIAIANHNSGTADLTLPNWGGATIEPLDPIYAAKQFDAIPVRSGAMAFAANRLLLGNNVEGYDTSVVAPTFNIVKNFGSTVATSNASYPVYAMIGKTMAAAPPPAPASTVVAYIALFIKIGSNVFLLPREYSLGKGTADALLDVGGSIVLDYPTLSWRMPTHISKNSLIALTSNSSDGAIHLDAYRAINEPVANARLSLIGEANGVRPEWDTQWEFNQVSFKVGDVLLDEEPALNLLDGSSRAFMPNAQYDIGLRYYDDSLRTNGRTSLGTVSMPVFAPYTRSVVESIAITTNTATPTAVPSWAKYFALTLSTNKKSLREITFLPSIIKTAFRNNKGETLFAGFEAFANPYTGYTFYGLALSLNSLIESGSGYVYSAGDYVELSGFNPAGTGDSGVIRGRVLSSSDGYLFMAYNSAASANLKSILSEAGDLWSGHLNSPGLDGVGALSGRGSFVGAIQNYVYATILIGANVDQQQYEVAKFGKITAGNFGVFLDTNTTSTTIRGDHFSTKRTGSSGNATMIAVSSNEELYTSPITDAGRVALLDTVGQKNLYNMVRWSNSAIPGASINGYASFDATDYKTTDAGAGPITALVLTTKDTQDGGQLLVLCQNGSFATLVGQNQIRSANGDVAFTATVEVLGEMNALRGAYGCVSPRSAVAFEGKVWWVDAGNGRVIEFNESGAGAVSQFKAARLWKDTLQTIDNPMRISAGVSPYTGEVMVSVPGAGISQETLNTVPDLENPLDALSQNSATSMLYIWDANKWGGEYTSGAEFIHIGTNVYGFKNSKLWKEFSGPQGIYYGASKNAMVTIPFSAEAVNVKTPLTLQLTSFRAPDQTWIVGGMDNDAVTGVLKYASREGEQMAGILRNRVGGGATTDPQWASNSFTRERLKNKVVNAVFIWGPTGGKIDLTLATLVFDVSSGH